MKRVEHGALTVCQVGSSASDVRVPKRQPTRAKLRAVEFEPGLKLEDRVDQEPVHRLVVGPLHFAKARGHEQDIGRAEHLAAEE